MALLQSASLIALVTFLLAVFQFGSTCGLFDSIRSIQDLVGASTNPPHVHQTSDRNAACELLLSTQPDETLLPGTAPYERARAAYWDLAQQQATPSCIFQPRSPEDVALSLVILKHTNTSFAVKSGGHGQWHGESSIDGGVTIDLAHLAHIELDEGRQSLTVIPGNRWVDVYSALEPLGLTAVGGRSSYVGVGGFLQGGGISFYSNMYGWGLDNIREFEVVLGNSTITRANSTHNSALYKALRGGGANFGIVTSFVLDTYPYTGGWGGLWATTLDHEDAVIDALLDYGETVKRDPKPSLLASLHFDAGQWLWVADLFYCDGASSRPAAFSRLYKITSILDTTSTKSLSQKTWEMAQAYPSGEYNTMWVFCTKVDRRLIKLYAAAWQREGGKLADIAGIRMTAVIQHVTAPTTSLFSRRGGNGLGLPDDEPFLMFNIEPHWNDASQSWRVYRAMRSAAAEVVAEAERLGLAVDYTYISYASQFQDGFGRSAAGGAADSARLLAETSGNYDAARVFQDLRGGGFKLEGPYSSEMP
ncbi:FAD binding domain-containing protein [Chaetomium sp. MPI-SDFR-AT-0129]|nr:FAD binding domain-containing protein [Chaetomium sp. MPI-SDFR-AT-0129]